MAPDVLLHLVEPAAWRAALADGALRPPSLDDVGFVHLSTPDQVHLPAERLYPGRRDLVLLVVDPARLTDPVRVEAGLPADPGGMLFPHLYGPLPTSAVTAVVPYRPPAPVVLPAADDRLGRAIAYFTSLPIRRAIGVGDVPGGVAVLDPDHVHSHDNNRLLLTEPVDADTVERAAEDVGGNAGLAAPSRGAAVAGGRRRCRRPGSRGWQTEELLLMARPPAPDPGGRARRDRRPAGGARVLERSWRRDLPDRPDRERVIADLIGREHLNDRVVAVTDLVVREQGRVVASGQLRVDGATAAVDSVLTDPDGARTGERRRDPRPGAGPRRDGRVRPGRAGGGGRRLAAALVRPAWVRGRLGRRAGRRPARPEASDRREDRQQQVGQRGRRSSESSRSMSPPWPGSRFPMSLMPRSRLISDSPRSPIVAETAMRGAEDSPAHQGRQREREDRRGHDHAGDHRARRSPPTTSSG